MCGIAGYLNKTGEQINETVLLGMTEAIAHRGPDDQGIWIEGAIGLGHRRLSIRDLSSLGRQPFKDATGTVVISYNGEIYNYQQLKDELSREHCVEFQTSCDTEIIPYGYQVWGEELFDRLEGMFAIALWDSRSDKLILARDGIGIKPLYFYDDKDIVIFASEIKSLLAHPDICFTQILFFGLYWPIRQPIS